MFLQRQTYILCIGFIRIRRTITMARRNTGTLLDYFHIHSGLEHYSKTFPLWDFTVSGFIHVFWCICILLCQHMITSHPDIVQTLTLTQTWTLNLSQYTPFLNVQIQTLNCKVRDLQAKVGVRECLNDAGTRRIEVTLIFLQSTLRNGYRQSLFIDPH